MFSTEQKVEGALKLEFTRCIINTAGRQREREIERGVEGGLGREQGGSNKLHVLVLLTLRLP